MSHPHQKYMSKEENEKKTSVTEECKRPGGHPKSTSEISRSHLLEPFIFLPNSINEMRNKGKSDFRGVSWQRDDDEGDESGKEHSFIQLRALIMMKGAGPSITSGKNN